MKKKDLIVLFILSVVIGAMYLSFMPFALLEINLADITEGYIPMGLNMLLCILITFLAIKIFKVEYPLGFTKNGLANGLLKSLPVALVTIVIFAVANIIAGYPLTNTPSVLRVVLEGVIFFIIVGFMEELLLRGLVLNAFEGILAKSKHKTALAIMISSVFFAAGHIPAFIDQGIVIILFKFIYPLGVGVYFGYLYRKYNNIWVPIIIHAVVDIVCGTIVTFSANESDGFNPATVIIMSALSVFLLVYGIVKIVKLDKELQAESFEV